MIYDYLSLSHDDLKYCHVAEEDSAAYMTSGCIGLVRIRYDMTTNINFNATPHR